MSTNRVNTLDRVHEALGEDEPHSLRAQFGAVSECAILAKTDAQGRITFANDRFVDISGYSREELLGQDHRIVNSGHHPKAFFREMWRTIAGARVWRGEVCNRAKDGHLYWVDTVIMPIADADGKLEGYWSVRFDITSRKMAEEQSKRAGEALEESNLVRGEQARCLGVLSEASWELSRSACQRSVLSVAARAAADLGSCRYAGIFMRDDPVSPIVEHSSYYDETVLAAHNDARVRRCVERVLRDGGAEVVVDRHAPLGGERSAVSDGPIAAAAICYGEDRLGAVVVGRPMPSSPLHHHHAELPYLTLLCNIVGSAYVEMGYRAQLIDTQDAVVRSMGTLAEYRDQETATHLSRVTKYAELLAEWYVGVADSGETGLEALVPTIRRAMPLHDVGKICLPDEILKSTARFTTAERRLMEQHTVFGARIIDDMIGHSHSAGFLSVAREIAIGHHERWDGKGYPYGFAGEAIPLPARIAKVADVYDALRSKRRYKAALSHEEAAELMKTEMRSHFDPTLLEGFLTLQERFVEVSQSLIDEELALADLSAVVGFAAGSVAPGTTGDAPAAGSVREGARQ